ncbi:unnamed protein product [Amaranthus hypochondriacus]
MESPSRTLTLSPSPHSPSPTTFRRRRSSSDSANSPEFEFSSLGCDSQTTLLSADELFSDGFLLPLHLLRLHRSEFNPEPDSGPSEPDPGLCEPESEPSALITSSGSGNPILSASKRWREIFKRGEKKSGNITEDKPENNKLEKKKEKDRKSSSNINSSSAELNINIWPFSRSRSAGNNSGRSKSAAQSNRKVSSAPCSRSNSSGESKSRRSWPSSPGRPGVHLGRTSPVWQVKKTGPVNRTANSGGSGKGRVLKLNVPVCIGYRQSLSCGSDENGDGGGGGGGGDSGGGSGPRNGGGNGINNHLFSLRGFFSKKTTVLTV